MITLDNVKQVLSMGGIAFPYPRLGKISINGGRGQTATKDAIKHAQQVLKDKKGITQ
jgi:hypothetical protein